ncbi:penicillin-binding protein activator [Geoalkalibacter sp.]|uniref:penicillin-binding protein activator n=1 Tax=Geoalkalibacter sp. TaxID=3041440 RepID=UPI00272E467F|nr:penicillin-binding protein activator [Geoalkalibacter sp.]
MRRAAVAGLLVGCLILAGLGLVMPKGAGAASDPEVRAAIERYHAGRPEEALSVLRGFVIANPGSPDLPEAQLYLARIFHDQGQCAQAELYLERLPPGDPTPEVRLIRGSCLVQQGYPLEGATILLPLEQAPLAQADRALAFGRLGQAYAALDEPLRALLFYRQALELSAAPGDWLGLIHELLRDSVPEAVLDEAAFMFRGTPIGQDAALQAAQRAFARGDRERAAALLNQVLGDPTPFPYRDEARALAERLPGAATTDAAALGVILPLTGRFAPFGEAVRRGLDLAAGLHNQGYHQIRLIYRDSGAEAQQAAEAVTSLARTEGVLAIVGPLTGAAAQGAAERAQQEGVATLSLSPRDGLPQIGPWAFRYSLTSRQQAAALAEYAVDRAGLRRFAVLYPHNRLGEEMLALFSEEVNRRGGQVVRRQPYAEEATDFRAPIRRLMGLDPNAPDERAGTRAVPFEALFIPDGAERVGLIVPQLAYHGMEQVRLLGTSGWNSPELPRLGGRFVEGAVFVDGFFVDSPLPETREFVTLYRQAYGEEPSILAAQAFDAANLLFSLLGRPDIRSREDVRRALAEGYAFSGATGRLRVAGDGELERALFVIRVQNGELVQLSADQL